MRIQRVVSMTVCKGVTMCILAPAILTLTQLTMLHFAGKPHVWLVVLDAQRLTHILEHAFVKC